MRGSDVIICCVDVTSARLPYRQPKRIRAKCTPRTATTRVIIRFAKSRKYCLNLDGIWITWCNDSVAFHRIMIKGQFGSITVKFDGMLCLFLSRICRLPKRGPAELDRFQKDQRAKCLGMRPGRSRVAHFDIKILRGPAELLLNSSPHTCLRNNQAGLL